VRRGKGDRYRPTLVAESGMAGQRTHLKADTTYSIS
jgi:hypothetical protein